MITVTRRRQSRPQIISISHMELKIVLCHIVFPHMLSKTGFRYANYVRREGGGEESKIVKGGRRKKTRSHGVGIQACHFVMLYGFCESLMVSKGGEEKKKKVSQRRALLQDEQMVESKCGDLFYISIPCRGAGDVGFRFFFFSSSLFKMLSYRITDTRNV